MGQLDGIDLTEYYATLAQRFDGAAQLYDATYGPPDANGRGSTLMGWLRQRHQDIVSGLVPAGRALLDIGSGTGQEALMFAQAGYSVLGIDVSPGMVRQAQTKAAVYGIRRGISFRRLAAGQLDALDERGPFHGAYASQGTLNTEPNLAGAARGLHALLEPGAPFVATVMSRRCAFERLWNLVHLQPRRTIARQPGWHETRAGAGGVTALARFYSPREFAKIFAPYFAVESVQAFPLWLPPVHMHDILNQQPGSLARWEAWDRRMRGWPGLRAWGDHFLMVLRRTDSPPPPVEQGSNASS